MEARANRRHGHRLSIFHEQRGQGSFAAQGHGGPAGWRGGRFHPPAGRAETALSLQSLHFSGIQNLSVNPDEFRAVLGRFPSGVTVVTTRGADGADQGMTVSAFCSVSLEPPLVLVCIEKNASVYPALTSAQGFAVNILSAKQEQVARRFSIIDIDRFEAMGFTTAA